VIRVGDSFCQLVKQSIDACTGGMVGAATERCLDERVSVFEPRGGLFHA